MDSPQNPHDRLFKTAFSNQRIVQDYIRNFLPPELVGSLDLNSLQLLSGSFITPELHAYSADVIYSCQLGSTESYLSILLEHKSTPQKFPHLQLLRYMLEVWEQDRKQKGTLSPIIPIIVYHGKRKWPDRRFQDYFPPLAPSLVEYLPLFSYQLTDLSKWTDEALLQLNADLLINALLLLKHQGDDAYTRKSIKTLFRNTESLLVQTENRNLIVSFFVYLYQTSEIKQEEFSALLHQLPPTTKRVTMTTYESILLAGKEKGLEEGLKEGLQKGLQKGKIEKENLIIKNALSKQLPLQLIAELTELSIQEIKQRIQSFPSPK